MPYNRVKVAFARGKRLYDKQDSIARCETERDGTSYEETQA
jgi:tmRNA-binding protein